MHTQHAPLTDHDHAERLQRLATAFNRAAHAAASEGLSVDVGILSIETIGRAVQVPQLTSRVAREVEVR